MNTFECRKSYAKGLLDPRPATEIAMHTDVSVSTVHNVVSPHNRFGPRAIDGRGYGIWRRCYLNRDQQALFLKPFPEIAPKGEICVAGRIKHALDELLGHEVYHSTVYRMLHRNGWREIVPRPAHPERKEETREAFKITSRSLQARLWNKETRKILGR